MPSDLQKDFKEKKKGMKKFKQMYSDKEDQLNNLRLNDLVGDDVNIKFALSSLEMAFRTFRGHF